MIIGGKKFDLKRIHIMGILNMTPDSFYDGGKHDGLSDALSAVEQMIRDGAEIVDAGGESTRPGYTQISVSEEIDRVMPVIAAIKARFDIPVSCDTYKAAVASAALAAGADMINDIWGLKYDPFLAAAVAKSGAAVVLTHNRQSADYADFLPDVVADLKDSIALAVRAGIASDKIIIDPGVGFNKTVPQNLLCIARPVIFAELGFPLLLGTSNKSVIGAVLNLPAQERLAGTLAVTAYAALNGVSFVRVHNVRENRQVIDMIKAIKGADDL